MDKETEIAENLTIGDWLDLKARLEKDMENEGLWKEALNYFDKRFKTRYLQPIKVIENNSQVKGEGFSVVAIICSMIEALESFYQGKSYRKAAKGKPLDEQTEYYKSQPLFESFLTKREPFKGHFVNGGLAADFYENVRCAILHEAATRNGWKVNIKENILLTVNGNEKVINRVIFVQEIEKYMEQYKKEVMETKDLKDAFIRKFYSICSNA